MDFYSLYYVEGTLENKLDNVYDGVLEPFSIRESIELRTDFPYAIRSVKGAVGAGTEDVYFSSPQILQVDYFENNFGKSFFDDTIKKNISKNQVQAFSDDNSDVLKVIEGYIPINQKSGAAGWDYGSYFGTDSIAFGGTGY